jgi:hypothetical protein
MRPMSNLIPDYGQVILRLIYPGLNGNSRFVVGAKTFDGRIAVELSLTHDESHFDGWLPLPEECK